MHRSLPLFQREKKNEYLVNVQNHFQIDGHMVLNSPENSSRNFSTP